MVKNKTKLVVPCIVQNSARIQYGVSGKWHPFVSEEARYRPDPHTCTLTQTTSVTLARREWGGASTQTVNYVCGERPYSPSSRLQMGKLTLHVMTAAVTSLVERYGWRRCTVGAPPPPRARQGGGEVEGACRAHRSSRESGTKAVLDINRSLNL